MTIEQISIFIENRKNALAEFTNVLATHNINMRARLWYCENYRG